MDHLYYTRHTLPVGMVAAYFDPEFIQLRNFVKDSVSEIRVMGPQMILVNIIHHHL